MQRPNNGGGNNWNNNQGGGRGSGNIGSPGQKPSNKDEKSKDSDDPQWLKDGFIDMNSLTLSFEDVAGLDTAKTELKEATLIPLAYPEFYRAGAGTRQPPKGLLLYGPPGTGKTFLVKALVGELNKWLQEQSAGPGTGNSEPNQKQQQGQQVPQKDEPQQIQFISVSAAGLISKYVGESEKRIKMLYEKARSVAPCVIFIDEIDSMCGERGANGQSSAGSKVVTEFLVQMDGIVNRKKGTFRALTLRGG
jgi:SpoVK/Ycf46/Vps4 family AAA+-type ATPase